MYLVIVLVLFGTTLLGYLTGKHPKSKVLDEVDEEDAGISPTQAKSIADRLFQEFTGLGGSDFDVVNNQLKNLTEADFKRVYASFGQRRRDDILGTEGGWFFGNAERDLIYWLNAELKDEVTKLIISNPRLPI